MSKKSDFDNKLKQLSRKTDVEIFKQNMGFEAELKKLDEKINEFSKKQIDEFDNSKDSLSKYLDIGTTNDFVERYRKKLDGM